MQPTITLEYLVEVLKEAIAASAMFKQEIQVVPSDLDPTRGASVILNKPIGLISVCFNQEGVANGYHMFMDPASDAAYAAGLGVFLQQLATQIGVVATVAGVCAFVPGDDGNVRIVYDVPAVYEAYQSLFAAKAKELGVDSSA